MDVIVVGAGIIGASCAWHLAQSGASVTVIDGGARGASQSSFGWINASFFANADHHRLRAEGMAAHGRLLEKLPHLLYQTKGACWWEEQGAQLYDFKSALEVYDYPVKIFTNAEVCAIAPDLGGLPEEVLHFPSEGAVDAAEMARELLRQSGARTISGVKVTGFLGQDHVQGVMTDIGPLAADRVVLAAGTGSADILASAGLHLPMLRRPGVLVTTNRVEARIPHILVTPHGEVRQLPDGRLLASAVAGHQGDASTEVTEPPEEIAACVLSWLAPMIPRETLTWEGMSMAFRPMPTDGLPVLGPAGPQGLHVAVMHSGVTLAAIAGEITAAQVMGQATNAQKDLIAPYTISRFAES